MNTFVFVSLFNLFHYYYTPSLLLLTLCITIRKKASWATLAMSEVLILKKEGRKQLPLWCIPCISCNFHCPISENSCLYHLWWKASQTCHNQPNIPIQVSAKNFNSEHAAEISTGLNISTGRQSIQSSLENNSNLINSEH